METIVEPGDENSTNKYLIVRLKDIRKLKCPISNLNKSREEF